MEVINRHGQTETMSFNKIEKRILNCVSIYPSLDNIDVSKVLQKIINELPDKIITKDIDLIAARVCTNMYTIHPDYNKLSSRIIISNSHKYTKEKFSTKINILKESKKISNDVWKIVNNNSKLFNDKIDYSRDYNFDFISYMTLAKSYLIKIDDVIIERIQDLLMRVSIGIHKNNLDKVFETYELMSEKYFIMATPCLYNAGTLKPQLLSCFLLGTEDSCEGIMKSMSDAAIISRYAGGIGLCIDSIRAKNSIINGTGGKSSGCVNNCKILNATMRTFNQGGKRLGSCAVYMQPHHADIKDFIKLKSNTGDENSRARDLFYGLMINNLFMEKVENDEHWCLFSPDDVPELNKSYGEQYRIEYKKAETEGKYRDIVSARELFKEIVFSHIETGMPYLLNKDEINEKSNQKNYGTIQSSNLCAEIVEYSDDKEYACCTLGSISLPKFVENGKFNFVKLKYVVKVLTNNLNNIIDLNLYPVPETKISNMKHRPLGLGVQGLADVFAILKYPFDSDEAKLLNKQIFATIYYGALEQSLELSIEFGPYESYNGSPISEGKLQFDLWNTEPLYEVPDLKLDWDNLKKQIIVNGVRNSLLLSVQPTASTAQILGNNESIEPYTNLIYTRTTLAGTFFIINEHLVYDLIKLDLWNEKMKNSIIKYGSIQNNEEYIKDIPEDIKKLYKTAWEMSMKDIIDMSADRGIYICQTQSLNLFIKEPTLANISSMHMYSYKKKLKTCLYYLRSRPQVHNQQFTIEAENTNKTEVCESCSG